MQFFCHRSLRVPSQSGKRGVFTHYYIQYLNKIVIINEKIFLWPFLLKIWFYFNYCAHDRRHKTPPMECICAIECMYRQTERHLQHIRVRVRCLYVLLCQQWHVMISTAVLEIRVNNETIHSAEWQRWIAAIQFGASIVMKAESASIGERQHRPDSQSTFPKDSPCSTPPTGLQVIYRFDWFAMSYW